MTENPQPTPTPKKAPALPTRKVCIAHPGRPVVAVCVQCQRAICRSCVLGRSPICSQHCYDKYLQSNPLALENPKTVLLVLILTVVIATLVTGLGLYFLGVL
ncbi:MAG: hypothetical protein P1V97_04585 [Planctomycetota bacterium]|nr:hypothetical protein [Planctomycetota bacterium]